MDFLKICPVCRTSNPAHEMVCQRCLADISSVEYQSPLRDAKAQSDQKIETPDVSRAVPEKILVKEKAEEADSAVTVVQSRKKIRLRLDNFELEIDDGTVIGRMETGKEIFMQFPGISRKHARFSLAGPDWMIEDLGSTNGTFLNGQQLKENVKYPLKMGDRLGFSRKVTFEIISFSE